MESDGRRVRRFTGWAAAVVCLLLGAAAPAATLVPITNAGFETAFPVWDPLAPEPFSVGNVPGWNVLNAGGVLQPNLVSEVSFDAAVGATIDTRVAYSSGHLVHQFLVGLTYDANTVYALSLDVGFRKNTQFFGMFGFYRPTNPFPSPVFTTGAVVPGEGLFSRQNLLLTPDNLPPGALGQTVIIGFQAFAFNGVPSQIHIDNVRLLTSAVPLPAAGWLLLSACSALGAGQAARRGRRR